MTRRSTEQRLVETGKANFAAKALLVATLASGASAPVAIGCSPDIVIKNRIYDPNQTDAGCKSIASCASGPVTLRQSGSTAGSTEGKVGNVTVRLLGIEDSGNSKKANIELEACGKKANAPFSPKTSALITLGNESYTVVLETMEYDVGGLKLDVVVTPVCSYDGGIKPDILKFNSDFTLK